MASPSSPKYCKSTVLLDAFTIDLHFQRLLLLLIHQHVSRLMPLSMGHNANLFFEYLAPAYCEYHSPFSRNGQLIPYLSIAPASPGYSPTSPQWSPSSPAHNQNGAARTHNYQAKPSYD